MPKNAAADIGFGHTKLALPREKLNSPLRFDSFPSLAPPATLSVDLRGGGLTGRDTIQVDVDGTIFEVGKGVLHALPSQFTRILDASYPKTNQYLALLRAALYYIGMPEIDMLVLGLPVNTFMEYRDAVKDLAMGAHLIPNPRRRDRPEAPPTMSVQVKAVRVVPQPVGALYNYSMTKGILDRVQQSINLVFDSGYGTADWFVSSGMTAQAARCGSHFGGVSTTLQVIADQLRQGLRDDTPFLERIDASLRDWSAGGDGIFKYRGQDVAISSFASLIKAKTDETLSAMQRSVGSLDTIDNVVLTGGSSFLYKKQLLEIFPAKGQVYLDPNPRYSVVSGFDAMGAQALQETQGRR